MKQSNNNISISAQGIYKSFGDVQALDNISFGVNKGEIFGFIGPDGAGKTTLFRILTTLLLPDSGTAVVEGNDIRKNYRTIRSNIGYMPGKFSLYQDLTVEENLSFFATVFGTTIEKNYDLIKTIYSHIEPFKKRRAGKLSGGMKQKLALSCALIHRPSVLVLDEPTTGVDAVSRREFWEMLREIRQKGITVLVSTPYMDEAGMCDRIALIQDGKILDINMPVNIIEKFEKKLFAIRTAEMFRLVNDLREYPSSGSAFLFGQYVHYTDKDDESDTEKIEKYLKEKGHSDIEIKTIKANIEDCFMELLNR